MSRPSFRARPIDIAQALAIVRDESVLNDESQAVAREVTHAHKNLDKDNEEVLTKPVDGSKSKDGKADEIPIPEIRKVSSYEQDYRANFVKPSVYLRSPAFGAPMSEIVEYDLDNDDDDWLTQYNDGQNRLPAEKLELMIWKLEIACGEATEHWMAESAATATEKGQIISYQDRCIQMASTAALPKEKALALLSDVSGRPALLEAVYKYWTEKRLKTGKPCLRRLQPPPAPGDSNPFNVFRQREKTNRPQTRRRRENDGASYDKMRAIRRQMEMVYAVVELQLRREEKKLEAVVCERDSHALQIKLRHEPRTVHEEIEAEFAKKPSAKPLTPKELEWDPQRPVALPLSQAEVVVGHDGAYRLGGERFAPKQDTHAGGKHGKKRRRDDAMAAAMPGKGYDPRMMSALGGGFGQHGMPPGYALGPDGRLLTDPAVLARNRSRPIVPIVVDPYQPPPEIPDIEMIFAMTPAANRLARFVLPLGMHKQHCRPRIARGGRIVFDRKDPLTRQPYFNPVEGLPMDPDEDSGDENTPAKTPRMIRA